MKKFKDFKTELDEGLIDDIKSISRDIIPIIKDLGSEFVATIKWLFNNPNDLSKQQMKDIARVLSLVKGDEEFKKLIRGSFEHYPAKKGQRLAFSKVKKGRSIIIKNYMKDRLPANEQDKVETFYRIISKVERGELDPNN